MFYYPRPFRLGRPKGIVVVRASVRPYNRGLRDDFSVKFGVYVTILLVWWFCVMVDKKYSCDADLSDSEWILVCGFMWWLKKMYDLDKIWTIT